MATRMVRFRRRIVRSALAVGVGAVASYLFDPASGLARRTSMGERIVGLVPGSVRGTSREEIAPGPPIGGQDAQHQGQGDPTGGAGLAQLTERQ